MNILVDFIEQLRMLKGYTEHRFSVRTEEGQDVNSLLNRAIPGDDGETPLQIVYHSTLAMYKFVQGTLDQELDLDSIELPVDQSLPASKQISEMYQLQITELEKLGNSFQSLDDIIILPFNKKETPLREAVRFFVFHTIEHGGQVIRFQHHLNSCTAD